MRSFIFKKKKKKILFSRCLFIESETPRILIKHISWLKFVLGGMPLRVPGRPCYNTIVFITHPTALCFVGCLGATLGPVKNIPVDLNRRQFYILKLPRNRAFSLLALCRKYQLVFFNCCPIYFTASLRMGCSLLLPHNIRACFQRAEKID